MTQTQHIQNTEVKFVEFNISDLLNAASPAANKRARKLLLMAQMIVDKCKIEDDGYARKEIVSLTMCTLNDALLDPYTKGGALKAVAVVWLKTCPDDELLAYCLHKIIRSKRTDYQRGEIKHGSRFRKKPLTDWEKTERRLSADGENSDENNRIRSLAEGDADRLAGEWQSHVRGTREEVEAREMMALIMKNGATSPEFERMIAWYAVLALRNVKPDARHDPSKPKRDGFTRPLVTLMGVPASTVRKLKTVLRGNLIEVKVEMLE